MGQLTRGRLAAARRFLDEVARPLDRALFRFWFGGVGPEAGVDALARYQNDDGGFGHGLEPDFRLEASSAVATTIGLQYADDLKLPSDHPLVRDAVRYLMGALDPEALRWPAVPRAVNAVPHAPWWHVDEETGRSGVEGTWANPSAEVVGWLWQHARWVPSIFRDRLTDKAQDEWAEAPFPFDLHDFLCWERLRSRLPPSLRPPLEERLLASLDGTVRRSRGAWAGYGAEPLTLAPSPGSLLSAHLKDVLPENLDYRIASQAADGGWWPNWAWEQYPDAWTVARNEWAGILTVRTLRSLADYGRLE